MKIPNLLQRRAKLTDACSVLVDAAFKETRGLTPDERQVFDAHAAEVLEINAELAKERALSAPDRS
jgi:hypothetical protein